MQLHLAQLRKTPGCFGRLNRSGWDAGCAFSDSFASGAVPSYLSLCLDCFCLPPSSRAKEGGGMAKSERRITPRFSLNTPMSFHRMEKLSEGEQQTTAINISTRGVYFATSLAMCVGEAVEVLLEVPRLISGTDGSIRRFVGRVAHIESQKMPQGFWGIGVQLLYYERDLVRVS